ncbi:MAG: ATP-dependent DNA helicase [Candidatus Thermoplasmatota archaeon]|nr:ATP-dependent DNA helicase [Candidatus Thermoplasmatota archaeon]
MVEDNSVELTVFFAHQKLRDGQKEMLRDSINALKNGGHHLAAAPTGIGKTAAALAASLEIISNSPNKKIFFLTGRQSQHKIVIETLRTINNSLDFQNISCVDLIGRHSMCLELDSFTGKCNCEPGLPGNLKKMGYDDLTEIILEHPLHVDEVIKKARNRVLCPWKVLRNAAKSADIIVCDYNHLFIDTVRESSLPALGANLEDSIIIVDEAHNLPSRIRTGLERRLTTRILQHARFELEEFIDEMGGENAHDSWKWGINTFKKFEKVMNNKFNEWRSKVDSGKNEMRINTSEFLKITLDCVISNEWDDSPEAALSRLSGMLKNVTVEQDDSLNSNEKELNCWRISALFETIIRFQNKKGLVLVFNNEHSGRLSSHLLDPSEISKPIFSKSAGSILMSGTLYPPKMYSDILGLSALREVTCKEYTSPFESHNKPISIATDVTTRFKQRGAENTRKICEHIYAVAKETPGHIAVFAPSYRQLDEFIDTEGWPNRIVIKETSEWKKSEVDQIIPDLEKYKKSGQKVILAGVFGGKLSEGIDYKNNILEAVICIGIPVAPPSVFSDALREFLETKFGRNKGWLYGSIQPAVNSVIQAMGRPIRSSDDRAFIVLLDSRHLDHTYRGCHPSNFSPLTCSDSQMTRRYIARFFSKKQSRS